MSLPVSSSETAILPLRLVEGESQIFLMLPDPDRYCIFLLARMSEAEYRRECEIIKAALTGDAEIQRLREEEKEARQCAEVGFYLIIIAIGFFFYPCYASKCENARSALHTAWWRVFDQQLKRLNTTYAPRGLRFEVMSRVTRSTYACWMAVKILPPELIPLAAAQIAAGAAAPIATGAMPMQAMPIGMPPAYSESSAPGVAPSTAHGRQLVRVAPAPSPSLAAPAQVRMGGSEHKSHTQA